MYLADLVIDVVRYGLNVACQYLMCAIVPLAISFNYIEIIVIIYD